MKRGAPGCAFVTGGSRGIGAATARMLADQGWHVAVGFRHDRTAAEQVLFSLPESVESMCVQGDMSQQQDVERAFDSIEARFGRVAVLVNNAGIHHDGLAVTLDDEHWSTVLDVNLTASFRTSRRAAMSMVRARHGRIINLSSLLGSSALPGTANYAAAKAGVGGLTRSLAIELASRGITVNAVAPGLIRTDLVGDVSHFENSAKTVVPARREGTPQDVAACVAFLASDSAAYINGQTLAVDGGLSVSAFHINA